MTQLTNVADNWFTMKYIFTKDPFTKKTCFYSAVGNSTAWVYRSQDGWKTAVTEVMGVKWLDGAYKSRKLAERAVLQILGVHPDELL